MYLDRRSNNAIYVLTRKFAVNLPPKQKEYAYGAALHSNFGV